MNLPSEHRREGLRAAMGAARRVLLLGADAETVMVALRRGAEVWCVDRCSTTLDACRQRVEMLASGEAQVRPALRAAARRVHWINARVYLPPVAVELVAARQPVSPLLEQFDWTMIDRFKQLYEARYSQQPRLFPGQLVLTAEPVLHTFSRCLPPVPHIEAAAVCAANTWTCGNRQVLDVIDYRDSARQSLTGSALLRVRIAGPCNAVRFQITHRAGGYTWCGNSLLLPLAARVDASRGDRLQVNLDYQPGGSLESFAGSV